MDMEIARDISFDGFEEDPSSFVLEVRPKVFRDSRGSFCEVLNSSVAAGEWSWLPEMRWVRQVNRSVSKPNTVRGCHAQKGRFCQGKLVQALTSRIYDVITDARPDSGTFGVSNVYELDPEAQNSVWVPRGFLHSFVVPFDAKRDAVFEYFCDNVYDRESEFGVNPATVVPRVAQELQKLHKDDMKATAKYIGFFNTASSPGAVLSEKDASAEDFWDFMSRTKTEFEETGRRWYR